MIKKLGNYLNPIKMGLFSLFTMVFQHTPPIKVLSALISYCWSSSFNATAAILLTASDFALR